MNNTVFLAQSDYIASFVLYRMVNRVDIVFDVDVDMPIQRALKNDEAKS